MNCYATLCAPYVLRVRRRYYGWETTSPTFDRIFSLLRYILLSLCALPVASMREKPHATGSIHSHFLQPNILGFRGLVAARHLHRPTQPRYSPLYFANIKRLSKLRCVSSTDSRPQPCDGEAVATDLDPNRYYGIGEVIEALSKPQARAEEDGERAASQGVLAVVNLGEGRRVVDQLLFTVDIISTLRGYLTTKQRESGQSNVVEESGESGVSEATGESETEEPSGQTFPSDVLIRVNVLHSEDEPGGSMEERMRSIRERGETIASEWMNEYELSGLFEMPNDDVSPIVSPFANLSDEDIPETRTVDESTPHTSILVENGDPSFLGGDREFTVENVDSVLEEVRPYLIADGGNVTVMGVDVENRTASLRLEGACGGCSAATDTFKLGIEKRLKEVWPLLDECVRVSEDELNAVHRSQLSTASIDHALKDVMWGLTEMGVTITPLQPSGDNIARLIYTINASPAQQNDIPTTDGEAPTTDASESEDGETPGKGFRPLTEEEIPARHKTLIRGIRHLVTTAHDEGIVQDVEIVVRYP